jgi:preprotein translocase SecE subunit
MNAITTYLQNVRNEMTHVVWPTPRKAIMDVVAVVLISAAVAAIIAGLDYVFTDLVSYIVNNGI